MKVIAISALIMYQNIPLNCRRSYVTYLFNPLNAELNPICHLLALLAHLIFHVSGLRVNAGLNLFLSPDKSLIVFGKWL